MDANELLAQVEEAMAGGRQFPEYEEVDAGRFVGNDMNRKPMGVMRAVAVNLASKLASGDAEVQVQFLVEYMQRIKADLLLASETHLYAGREAAMAWVVSTFARLGYGCRCTLPKQRNSGVMIVWRQEGISAAHFREGPEGRALFATLVTNAGEGKCRGLRVGAVYGVAGGDMHTMSEEKRKTELRLNQFVSQEVEQAVDSNLIPLVGGDLNSVDNPAADSRGTGAVHRSASLVSSLLSTGMIDTFRVMHPTMCAVSRCTSGRDGNRIDAIMVWPSEEAECVAA